MSHNLTNRKISSESSLGIIIPSAILVVGLSKEIFRPKDLIFFIDLIKDMLRSNREGGEIAIQFIQVQRWLARYVEWGWLTRKKQGRYDAFKIKRMGLKFIVQKLTDPNQHLAVEEALLVQQLIDAYGPLLRQALASRNFDNISDSWLEGILTPKIVLRQQWQLLTQTIAHQERRLEQSLQLQEYLRKAKSEGLSFEAILENMPSPFSYTRQHQKPIREVLGEFPKVLAEFEFYQGIHLRQKYFYTPMLTYLYLQRSFYESLLTGEVAKDCAIISKN
jgi:hypothetical protein